MKQPSEDFHNVYSCLPTYSVILLKTKRPINKRNIYFSILIIICLSIVQLTSAQQEVQSLLEKPTEMLPVEITSFTYSIEGADVILRWTVAQQINNFGFEIYRKGYDSIWVKIGFVMGKGTSFVPDSFSLMDKAPEPGTYYYRLKQIDLDETIQYYPNILTITILPTVGVVQGSASIANSYLLLQNYPSPFNPCTTIKFSVPITEHTMLNVFNLCGQEIATLFDGIAQTGKIYIAEFDASYLPSGFYIARLQQNNHLTSLKLLLVK